MRSKSSARGGSALSSPTVIAASRYVRSRRLVLERERSRLGEVNVDDQTLGGSDQELLDELLALVVSAVRPHELHPRTG